MPLPQAVRIATLLPAALIALSGCAEAPVAQTPAPRAVASPVAAAVESITPEDIYRRVAYLASDEMRGRATPSPGLDSAAAYIAAEYGRLGLQPGGVDGTFYQRYPLRTLGLDTATVHFGHLLADGSGNQMLAYGSDFFALPAGSGEGLDMNHAHLVFVGALGPDGLPRGDYEGTVPIVTLPAEFGPEWQVELARARAAAAEAGATALAAVAGPGVPPTLFQRLSDASRAGTTRVVGDIDPRQVAVFVLSDQAFRELAAREGFAPPPRPNEPIRFDRVEAHFAAQVRVVEEAWAPNVVAMLPGSDPLRKDEYVILSAHMDHVGVGEPVGGDSIYNGADDDASGTSALLEVAEAMTMLPQAPARTVIFLHVSGEEDGLLGSEWFASRPTVPLERVVANVNVDMIGRNSPDSVVVIGKGYSTLGPLADAVQQRHPELGLTLADDIWPEENFFFRSDHFHFARKEIPAIFFFSGVHEDYHQPSDEVELLDTDKAARISRMIFYVVHEIAAADARPRWDPAGLAEVRSLTN